MTKYVLQSGGTRNNPEKAAEFYKEVIKGLGSAPRILQVLFAQKREDWEKKFDEYSNCFSELVGAKVKPAFELAMPDKFIEQAEKVSVINMCGGDDYLCQYWLKKFNLPRLFKGKVVATNSASSSAMATAVWTCDWRMCIDGLGILPIKFIPHYRSDWGINDPRGPIDWDKAYKELEDYGDKNLPIHALPEGEYKIFEVK